MVLMLPRTTVGLGWNTGERCKLDLLLLLLEYYRQECPTVGEPLHSPTLLALPSLPAPR
jgi:hypothetical protein